MGILGAVEGSLACNQKSLSNVAMGENFSSLGAVVQYSELIFLEAQVGNKEVMLKM